MYVSICLLCSSCVVQDTEKNCQLNVLKQESDQSLDSPKVSAPFVQLLFFALKGYFSQKF